MKRAVLAAANRTDNKVVPWLSNSDDDKLNVEQLGEVPRSFMTLDRKLALALITITKGALRNTNDTQEHKRVESGGDL